MVFMCLQYKSFETLWEKEKLLVTSNFSFSTVFSNCSEKFLPFLSNLRLSSANSFSLGLSKICCLRKGIKCRLGKLPGLVCLRSQGRGVFETMWRKYWYANPILFSIQMIICKSFFNDMCVFFFFFYHLYFSFHFPFFFRRINRSRKGDTMYFPRMSDCFPVSLYVYKRL